MNVYQTLVVHENGITGNGKFSLETFLFNGDTEASIYIHCDISLCDETTEQCEPLCDGSDGFQRRRRDLSPSENKTFGMKVGPIVLTELNPGPK